MFGDVQNIMLFIGLNVLFIVSLQMLIAIVVEGTVLYNILVDLFLEL